MKMRAKFRITNIERTAANNEDITLMAVSNKPFDADGVSEDNDFARWTPSGALNMSIANPNLLGKFQVGQAFYLDFTPADS